MDFNELFQQLEKVRVAVVGDVMLDTYWWGKVDRISPEAPVPVVALNKKEHRIGGAGNVALNCVAMGCETSIFSVIGDDVDGELLMGLLQERSIDTKYIIKSGDRITTNKIRVMSRSQQMIRVDAEVTDDILPEDEDALLYNFTTYLKRYQPAVVIFEDYNKGVLTEDLIKAMIDACKEHGVVTTVDPKRKNFFAYKGADIFKPNLKEVKEALNLLPETVNETSLRNIHAELHQTLQHKISLITLSEKGVFFQKGSSSRIIPTHIRNIADVSGAGDTVIAVASVVYATTKDVRLAAEMSNIAGGLVCEEVGTAAIGRVRLLQECKKLLAEAR